MRRSTFSKDQLGRLILSRSLTQPAEGVSLLFDALHGRVGKCLLTYNVSFGDIVSVDEDVPLSILNWVPDVTLFREHRSCWTAHVLITVWRRGEAHDPAGICSRHFLDMLDIRTVDLSSDDLVPRILRNSLDVSPPRIRTSSFRNLIKRAIHSK